MYTRTDSKMEQALEKALSRARSQRYSATNLKRQTTSVRRMGFPVEPGRLSRRTILSEAIRGDGKQE